MKKKLVIILPISIIIITATVLCILYFCTNIFKSGEQLFWGYIIKNSGFIDKYNNSVKTVTLVANKKVEILKNNGKTDIKYINK